MRFMKTLGLAIAASAFAIGAATAQEQVTIATEGAYAPWNFSNPDGTLDGFEIELARDLCERMEADCEIIAQDWNGIIPGLTAGRYDAIMAGMSITAEREEVISFAGPYTLSPNGFLVPNGSDLADMPGTGERFNLDTNTEAAMAALEEVKPLLEGKVIGVQGSTTHANFAREHLADVAEIREYGTTEQHDLDLQAGRIDAVLADAPTLRATMEKPEFQGEFSIVGPGYVGGILGRGVGVGLRQEDEELRTRFNEAIAAAAADGTIKELSEKWFGTDLTPAM
ncbi:transporter substrate-binding domain-containing protein [Salinarimonas ramus]|uniref:Nopaline-binding periplasmic protein n=1 Tax=Salinarimonas ramus TaxID=690164 RepID=A0A917V5Q7_9HYPH|nr:transporter substrate-binding domain-containing protein [Salinarimonas ramus]GGK43768.1 nopaline-binding periplasmic protein [Salinarimonas ramus]